MPQMGRRRQSNLDLPPRMHLKSGTYYYVTNEKPRRWIKLSKDFSTAKRKWAEFGTTSLEDSVAFFIDKWLESPPDNLAESSLVQYRSVAGQLKYVFERMTVQAIRPHHVYTWLDNHDSPARANLGKAVLAHALELAKRRGKIDTNPAKEVERLTVQTRKRNLLDDEFLKIREQATPELRAAMNIAYVTGCRISDVIKIRHDDITEDGVYIVPQKHRENNKRPQLFRWNDALRQAIEEAKKIPRQERGVYILCTRRGTKYSYATFYTWWCKAVEKAGVENANIHDIRKKTRDQAELEELDYQAILGHATKAQSDKYLATKRAKKVDPIKKIL